MRPPWICPGAPACSGNTHWISSVTVSAIDGIGSGTGPRDALHAAPAPVLARGYAALQRTPARGAAGECGRAASGRDAGDDVETDAGQAMEAGRVQAEIADFGPGHAPHEADVDRHPRQVLGQERLGALVETRALGTEGQLTGADQDVVEPRVLIEGIVEGPSPLGRALAGRQRIEEEVRVAA